MVFCSPGGPRCEEEIQAEEIVAKLRQVVLTSQDQSVAEGIRSIGVSEGEYYSVDGSPMQDCGEWFL